MGSSWGSWNELLCPACYAEEASHIEWTFAERADTGEAWVNSLSQRARLEARGRGAVVAGLDEGDVVGYLNSLERRPRCAACTTERLAVEAIERAAPWWSEPRRDFVCRDCLTDIGRDAHRYVVRHIAVWSTPAGGWQ